MMTEWAAHDTSRHQDHVIAHVLGATVLGYFEFDEAAHFFLDIGFIWTLFLDGEMALVPHQMAINELELDMDAKAELMLETTRLEYDPDAEGFQRLTRAPAGCLIREVSFYAYADKRRVRIECEGASLNVDTSLQSGEIQIVLA